MTNIALALVIAALLLVLWLAFELNRLKRRIAAVPEEGGVFEAIRRLDTDLGAAEERIADMAPRLKSVEATLPMAIQHTAVVSYDAYGDIAGNLSRSIVLINGHGDGVVVSLLVGRDETRWFTKMIRGGVGAEPLSPEESAALGEAMRR